jgi:IclR family pca regulon transcriptional regulator
VGTRYPAHATSLGKVLLAFGPADLRASYLARPVFEAPTDQTLATVAQLAPALVRVAQQGYAVSIDELDYGVASIAVPIRDAAGQTIAAINSSGYSGRQTEAALVAARLEMLQNCARAISARIATGGGSLT